MTNTPAWRLIEAAIAAFVVAIVALVVASYGDLPKLLASTVAFGVMFVGTLWRTRGSTVHHTSRRRARSSHH